jgi:mannose-6-phosphate isomerase-like protein (cupin superfamily)
MDQGYGRGWRRYAFDEVPLSPAHAHGSDVTIRVATAFNRGPGQLQTYLLELPPHSEGEAIALHIHRDVPTGKDVEELYILVDGDCMMTFSNGDEVPLRPGDVVTTYPGTGHAIRVVGDQPARVVAVVPHGYRTDRPAAAADPFPEVFNPRIQVVACHPTTMTPLEARCTRCGGSWALNGQGATLRALPEWASDHACPSA